MAFNSGQLFKQARRQRPDFAGLYHWELLRLAQERIQRTL